MTSGEPITEAALGSDPAGPPGRRPARRAWRLALTVAVVLGLSGLLAFGLITEPGSPPSALVGRRAPGFELKDMDGSESVRLQDFRGQVVILNCWASWCAACRREHPRLVAVWDRYRERGIVVLGVLFQDEVEDARRYMAELGGDWPTLLDPGSRTAIDYGVYGVPETFFIGRDGMIAHKQVGEVTYEGLVAWTERLLRPRPAAGR